MKIKLTLLFVLSLVITSCHPKTVAEIKEQESTNLRNEVKLNIENLELHVSEMTPMEFQEFELCKLRHAVAENHRSRIERGDKTTDASSWDDEDRDTLDRLNQIKSHLN
jgi:hypothetical protein